MSLRQLSRRNTEEHLSDAFNDALAASAGPRSLERQNSSFLTTNLTSFLTEMFLTAVQIGWMKRFLPLLMMREDQMRPSISEA